MFGWLRKLTRKPDTAGVLVTSRNTGWPAPTHAPEASTPAPSGGCSPFCWLLQVPASRPTPLNAEECRILDAIDETLAQNQLPENLLPRAPAVIPQLLHLLRQPEPSRKEVVERLSKDLVLATEVLRLARSVFFKTSAEIGSLDDAVAVVGESGVKAAIARVVLKPMFDPRTGGLANLGAQRNWAFAERQAERCAQLAADAEQDRLDGFLAGMLHATGRIGLLRMLDLHEAVPSWPCSRPFDDALGQRSTYLTGRFLAAWQITPGLTLAARMLMRDDNQIAPGTLAWAVLESERQTLQDVTTINSASENHPRQGSATPRPTTPQKEP